MGVPTVLSLGAQSSKRSLGADYEAHLVWIPPKQSQGFGAGRFWEAQVREWGNQEEKRENPINRVCTDQWTTGAETHRGPLRNLVEQASAGSS